MSKIVENARNAMFDIQFKLQKMMGHEPCAEDSSGLDEYFEEMKRDHYELFVSKGYIVDLEPPITPPTK